MASSYLHEINIQKRQCYEALKQGKTPEQAAEELRVPVSLVADYARQYAAKLEGEEAAELQVEAKKAAWRERTELVYDRLDRAYMASAVSVEKYVDAYTKLAKTAFSLDGLAAAKKLDIATKGSKVDQEIENLLGLFPAADEEDMPI